MERSTRGSSSVPRLFFSSPEEAVERISDLLRTEDFKTLACYYDLSGSDIDRVELESGEFFVRKQRPEVAHPGGFWRYKHPFAPGFKYWDRTPSATDGVFVVRVGRTIDQGAGSPMQAGFSLFLMTQSDRGWQVLPQPADVGLFPDMPSTVT